MEIKVTEEQEKCAIEIINSIEKYISNCPISTAEEILKFEIYCNPVVIDGKHISPSIPVRASWDILCSLLIPDFVKTNYPHNEVNCMKIVYAHFYKNDKNYRFDGSLWVAGFIQDLLKSKVKNKKMIRTWYKS